MEKYVDLYGFDIEEHLQRHSKFYAKHYGKKKFAKIPIGNHTNTHNLTLKAVRLWSYLCEKYSYYLLQKSIVMKISLLECSARAKIYKQDLTNTLKELSSKNKIIMMRLNPTYLRGEISIIIPDMLDETDDSPQAIDLIKNVFGVTEAEATKIFLDHLNIKDS